MPTHESGHIQAYINYYKLTNARNAEQHWQDDRSVKGLCEGCCRQQWLGIGVCLWRLVGFDFWWQSWWNSWRSGLHTLLWQARGKVQHSDQQTAEGERERLRVAALQMFTPLASCHPSFSHVLEVWLAHILSYTTVLYCNYLLHFVLITFWLRHQAYPMTRMFAWKLSVTEVKLWSIARHRCVSWI